MANGILVFIEQRNGQVRKSSLEALSEARRQSPQGSEPVVAVIVGAQVKPIVAELAKIHPDNVLVVEGPQFANYSSEAYAEALSQAIKKVDPRYVFAAHTSMAKDLIGRVAARFDAPAASDAVAIKKDGANLLVVRPMYSGKTQGLVEFNAPLAFITLRPNVFPAIDAQNGTAAPMEEFACAVDKVRAQVKETHAAAGQKIELSEASRIVAGGRGLKGPENWPVLQDLCDTIGAALGASRAVVDAGWIDHQHQVGQTGKTVSPQLYIACGISGAIQHLAGMSSSKVIVAINKDADAPIFKHCTYGIVGDALEVVPKLTAELKKLGLHK